MVWCGQVHGKITFFFIILMLAVCAVTATASEKKVYVHTDENGILVFSDKPEPGAQVVNLNKRQQLTMPSVDTSILEQLQNQDKEEKPLYQVFIDQPLDQATIRDNHGNIYVTGHVTPSFRTGFKVRLLLDGKQRQKPHSTAIFRLKDVDRGEHTLVLELLDSSGQVLAVSEPRTVYLFRTSTIRPNQG